MTLPPRLGQVKPAARVQSRMESADQSYTGERLAPFADEAWWREHIGRWSGIAWRGELRMGRACGVGPFNKIEVRQANSTDELEDDLLPRADSAHAGTRWMRTEIIWNEELLERLGPAAVEVALAHELGRAFGL